MGGTEGVVRDPCLMLIAAVPTLQDTQNTTLANAHIRVATGYEKLKVSDPEGFKP